jgi:hypothetical protein
MAEESFIQLPPDSIGKKLRAVKRTIGGNTVYIEVFSLEDEFGRVFTPSKDEMDRRLLREITYDQYGNISEIRITDKESNKTKIRRLYYDGAGNIIRIDEDWA